MAMSGIKHVVQPRLSQFTEPSGSLFLLLLVSGSFWLNEGKPGQLGQASPIESTATAGQKGLNYVWKTDLSKANVFRCGDALAQGACTKNVIRGLPRSVIVRLHRRRHCFSFQ